MKLDDGSLIEIILAGAAGVVTAVTSHFHLSGRVTRAEANLANLTEREREHQRATGERIIKLEERIDRNLSYIRDQLDRMLEDR
ncbi:MAG: hypothetical protein EP347_05030 [Alphaproteobacteria bacterium]|nr:MAG: hypothetical protein EP347_05030 [Alphaproteobacteria bacterium]